jgi:TetR/AcrR family transcriptional regulator
MIVPGPGRSEPPRYVLDMEPAFKVNERSFTMTVAQLTPAASPTRERILDASELLFAERGLAGTSVRDISARVGVTPGSLYNHFRGKQALYEAVLDRGIRPLLDLMQQFARRDPTIDAADEVIGAIVGHLGQHPRLPRLIQHEALTGGAHLARLAHEWIRPLMATGVAVMDHEPDSPWEREEYPLVIAAWVQIVFGHFTLSPLLLGETLDEDPLSSAGLESHTRFLRKLARVLMQARRSPGDGSQ